ncbi:MAG: DUF177 domain-containing protein [Solirubrobacterales bacterium]
MRLSGQAPHNSLDLTTLALKPGEGCRLDIELVPEALEMGGERYEFGPEPSPGRLDVSRTASGHAMRLEVNAKLRGLCMRCLAQAEFRIEVESREVDQPGSGDEELASPYVELDELDIGAWAHDAIALALPQTLLCRPECLGLCPDCGVSLNDVDPADHVHEREPDPRWAKLRELSD